MAVRRQSVASFDVVDYAPKSGTGCTRIAALHASIRATALP